MVNHQVQSIFILDQVLVYHRHHHNALSLVKVQQEDLDTLYRMDGILMATVTMVSMYCNRTTPSIVCNVIIYLFEQFLLWSVTYSQNTQEQTKFKAQCRA